MAEMTVNDAVRAAFEMHQKGDLEGAEEIYQQVIEQSPRTASALHLLGIIYQQRRRYTEAIDLFRRSIEAEPDQPEVFYNLGVSLLFLENDDEAEAAFERAVALLPSFAEAWNNLGHCRMIHHHPRAGAQAYSTAIRHKPTLAEAHNGLAIALKDLSQLDEALEHLRIAVQLKPQYRDAHSNLVYTLHYHPDSRPAQILEAHRQWSRQHADALTDAATATHDNARSPDRMLRVGYISPDFREHPVGLSMLPIVASHDPKQVHAICFSDNRKDDQITARLRAGAHEWHETAHLSDSALAELIKSMKIDVLLDLTMHMTRNRLLVFARRPAPVQASFLAYPATSGVRAIGWRITDRFLDPPGETEAFNSEKLIRLPHSFWCYPDDADALPIAAVPATRAGHITFGSLNNPCKFTAPTADLWAAVMHAVPDAHLLLLSFDEEPTRCHQLELLKQRGISDNRIEIIGRQNRTDYLASYARIDIGLDPLPYNGHFTTCDALFSGVPVISFRGTTSVGRAGQSILATLGLDELLANTLEQFVRIAADLAGDHPRLLELRGSLRGRMRSSPLMDSVGYTRAVENAYRTMWRAWCQTGAG
jgi:predicted O-linked N-acetylglucosamine transferase (SPINDLY family)